MTTKFCNQSAVSRRRGMNNTDRSRPRSCLGSIELAENVTGVQPRKENPPCIGKRTIDARLFASSILFALSPLSLYALRRKYYFATRGPRKRRRWNVPRNPAFFFLICYASRYFVPIRSPDSFIKYCGKAYIICRVHERKEFVFNFPLFSLFLRTLLIDRSKVGFFQLLMYVIIRYKNNFSDTLFSFRLDCISRNLIFLCA